MSLIYNNKNKLTKKERKNIYSKNYRFTLLSDKIIWSRVLQESKCSNWEAMMMSLITKSAKV